MRRKATALDPSSWSRSVGWFLSLVCLTAALMSSSAAADQGPQQLDADFAHRVTQVVALAADDGRIQLEATVSAPHFHLVDTRGGVFVSVDIDGEGVTTELGKPRIPVIRRLVEIPFGAEVTLGEISAVVEERTLAEMGLTDPLVPVQPPVPKIPGAEKDIPFAFDQEHYGKDEFWPPDLVRVREVGVWRQSRLALVEIFPIRQNPRSGLIRLCSRVQFDISLRGSDPDWTQAHQRRYTDGFTSRWNSSELFIKTEPHRQPMDGWSTVPVSYLMIVEDALYQALLPLAGWKLQEGFDVVVAKTSQTGSERDQIKDFIRNAYENWEVPPTFLLLVGDSETIPPYTVGGITTDLYYTTMSEEDYFPDIQVGRLAVADSTELAALIQKIVGHEKGLWENDDGWTRRGYFMASNDGWYHDLAEDTQEYSMQLARIHGMMCDSLYAYYGTGTPISTAVNNGRTMVVYTGHGSWYNWQGPVFGQNDVQALDNGQMFPLVCSHACYTGGFHKPVCFGETWIRTPGRGSAAFWGSSVSSYWDEDDILQRRMFDALFDSSLTWLSGMMDKAKLELWVYYGGGGLSESYYRQYNLLGDPSMYLWTRPPKTLVVEHADLLAMGSSAITATVREPRPAGPDAQDVIKATTLAPVDDALMSVIADEEIRGLAQTVRGNVSVALDPALVREEPVEVIVSKPGYRPYIGAAEVKADGPFLIYGHHDLDDSGGNGDGQANAGETVYLTVTIENTGNEAAGGITAILSESDPYVQMARSPADFGDIDAKGSGSGFPPYECHITEICPSGHHIVFSLLAADSTGRRWLSEFQIPVVAPDLVCEEYHILDGSPGGNGNGVAEPGETVDLAVVLRNQGLAAAESVSVTLSSVHPHVLVLSGSSAFGDMPPGAEASSTPPFQIFIDDGVTGLISCPLILDIQAAGGYVDQTTLTILAGTSGFSDDAESGPGQWTHAAITQEYADNWHLSRQRSHSDSTSWKCGDTGNGNYSHYEDAGLVSASILLAEGSVLTFWHWIHAEVYDARHAWDGGLVEISEDGGKNWEQISPLGGYPFTIWESAPGAGNPLAPDTPCFSGSQDWKMEEFDLSGYSGSVRLRFRFTSDQYTEREGWYIDDIKVDAAETANISAIQPQILLSGNGLALIWAPSEELAGPVRYEVYRADEPGGLIRREHLAAVVTAPQYIETMTDLKNHSAEVFYAVVAVDEKGRRSQPSVVVGCWHRRAE